MYDIIWSEWAELQMDDIYDFYLKKVSINVATQIIQELILCPERLRENPFICQDELLLQHRDISYKYIVCMNYKLIYSVDEASKTIRIADIFDTRQNPIKIERNS